jgi:hypothetical protein
LAEWRGSGDEKLCLVGFVMSRALSRNGKRGKEKKVGVVFKRERNEKTPF